MAYTDKTRSLNNYQKKSISVFASNLKEGTGADDIAVVTGNYKLANIPLDAVITNAYVHVLVASNAATSAAATLGTADGGAQILSGVNLKTLGKQGTLVGQVPTLTGKELYLNVTITGAATAVGSYVVVVEYLEFKKNTGELTRI
jgi:hypothetical protein